MEEEKKHLDFFFTHLDLNESEEILKILADCKGVLFFTGVGKSGIIAEKIAMTMTSTGTRSLYISPTNALHGDIGIVSDKDIFIILSKSGESDELFSLIPFLRNRGVKLIAIVSNPQSRLAKACDHLLNLPLMRELCPFDLAPTTSTVIQMIFGDILAVALMKLKNFSLAQYAENHPAGRIGKRITMKVKDLMITQTGIPLCKGEDKLGDTLVELSNKRCGCVLIVDEMQTLKGIFTDGDLRRALEKHGAKTLDLNMHDLMSRTTRWISPDNLAWEAMQKMEADQKNAISVLPVLGEEKKVVGIIKLHDIIQSGI